MMPLVLDREPAALVDNPEIPEPLRQRLLSICDAVQLESEYCFRFADLEPIDTRRPNPHAQPNFGQPQNSDRPIDQLVAALTPLVYHYCYTRCFTGTVDPTPAMLAANPTGEQLQLVDPSFTARLTDANISRPRWDPNWRIYQTEADGSVHVEKDGNNRLARPGEYSYFGAASKVAGVGDLVGLRVQHDSTADQPGFYFVFGESVSSDHDDTLLSRFYFHIDPETMPELLRTLCEDLNRLRVPFRMKCLCNPELYERADPAVLYIAKRFLAPTLRVIGSRRESIQSMLREGTPLFSKEIIAGLGAADEPGDGQSFGQSRCALVCKGIVDAWARGDESTEARLSAIDSRFRANGLSLIKPYLNEGAADLYFLPRLGTAS